MSGPAHYAAFKSSVLALVDTLHLSPEEVIGLGLSLAAGYAITAGIDRPAVLKALNDSLNAAEQHLPGIVTVARTAS